MCARKLLAVLAVWGIAFFPAAPVFADWDEGDGHKMHFPQLPDPQGWDVAWSSSWLGDDWVCGGSGPVSDVHFWVSFKEWNDPVPPQSIVDATLQVQIWSNNPNVSGGYSMPGVKLWEDTFTQNPDLGSTFSIRYAGSGPQGWYWPASQTPLLNDHTSYFQINIDDIVDPFPQMKGEVYWLVTKITGMVGNQPGWKTADLTRYPEPFTGMHFMDDAVFGTGISSVDWEPIEIYGISRDLAFVITPEPGTLALLAMAGLVLGFFAWRRCR